LTTEDIDGCIKFTKNTWHYKLVIFVFGKHYFSGEKYHKGHWVKKGYDTSLCEYFWTVVLCSLIFPFKGFWHILPYGLKQHEDIIKVLLIWLIVSIIVHTFVIFKGIGFPEVEVWYLGFVIFFGGIACALFGIGFLMLIMKLTDKYDEWLKNKLEAKRGKEHKIKKPSLALEFIKAKKSKICPCIKFVDEEPMEKQK